MHGTVSLKFISLLQTQKSSFRPSPHFTTDIFKTTHGPALCTVTAEVCIPLFPPYTFQFAEWRSLIAAKLRTPVSAHLASLPALFPTATTRQLSAVTLMFWTSREPMFCNTDISNEHPRPRPDKLGPWNEARIFHKNSHSWTLHQTFPLYYCTVYRSYKTDINRGATRECSTYLWQLNVGGWFYTLHTVLLEDGTLVSKHVAVCNIYVQLILCVCV